MASGARIAGDPPPQPSGDPQSAATASATHRRVVRWERFLPKRSLRVLLVEHDDSTRHIVAVLLRKCSYNVAAVADGMKAWEVMQERNYNVDLVLTEVEVPSLSGIGLLSKIVGTEECKNIPVIMMSSQDSIGVVLKCMLKGAADFLVKPIRRNELRNLWQHVWRKHCSNMYANASKNNAASNHISGIADDRSKTEENSDDGTDTQSSGRMPDTEVHNNKKDIECQVADMSFSKEETTLEQSDNNLVILASASKMDDGGETRGCQSLHLQQEPHIDVGSTLVDKPTVIADKVQEQNCSYDISPYRTENLGFMRSRESYDLDASLYYRKKPPNELVQDTNNSVEPTAKEQCNSHILGKDALKQDSRVQNTSNFCTSPTLELSLKRSQLNACTPQESKERLILNHTRSAFSRYGDKRIRTSCVNLVSSAPDIKTRGRDDNSQAHTCGHVMENENMAPLTPKEKFSSHQDNVGEASGCIQVSSRTNKEDGGFISSDLPKEDGYAGRSATQDDSVFRSPQYGFISLPIPFEAAPYQNLCAGYGAILHPMFYPESSFSPHSSVAFNKETIQISSDLPGHYDSHLANHSHFIGINHHEENHRSHRQRQSMDIEPRNPRDVSCSPMEHTYQSGSCSQNVFIGSGLYGSGETTDAAVNTGTALESGNESGVQNCNSKWLECDRSRREAALMKFRLKRKDRCFEKKVRYHSRKKLAEQRPRLKGQFVRQNIPETEADD